jgi:hypothetical protein
MRRLVTGAAGSIAAGYGAESFLLWATDVGAGGECGEGQEGDDRERLANGHGNLRRKRGSRTVHVLLTGKMLLS